MNLFAVKSKNVIDGKIGYFIAAEKNDAWK